MKPDALIQRVHFERAEKKVKKLLALCKCKIKKEKSSE